MMYVDTTLNSEMELNYVINKPVVTSIYSTPLLNRIKIISPVIDRRNNNRPDIKRTYY